MLRKKTSKAKVSPAKPKVVKPVVEPVLTGLGDAPTHDTVALDGDTADASTADSVAV